MANLKNAKNGKSSKNNKVPLGYVQLPSGTKAITLGGFIMKFLLTAMFAIIAAFFIAVPAYASHITVFAYGQQVNFPDQRPVIIADRTLVPMRGVFEHMGFTVDWNANTAVATLTAQGTTMTVRTGDSFFTVNGLQITPEVPPQIINGRFMLPLRAVAEATGATVDWLADTATVVIVPPSVAPTPPIGTVPPAPPVTPTPPIGEVPEEPPVTPTPPIGEVPEAPPVTPTPPIGEIPEEPPVTPVPPIGEVPEEPQVTPVPPIGEIPENGIIPPIGEIPDTEITPPIGEVPDTGITPPIGEIPSTTMNIGGTTYNVTFLGEMELNLPNVDFVSRTFYRVENAYNDFSGNPTTGNVLPFDNFPVAVDVNQVFAVVYVRADGSTETQFYRSSGLVWNDRPSTEEFLLE